MSFEISPETKSQKVIALITFVSPIVFPYNMFVEICLAIIFFAAMCAFVQRLRFRNFVRDVENKFSVVVGIDSSFVDPVNVIAKLVQAIKPARVRTVRDLADEFRFFVLLHMSS